MSKILSGVETLVIVDMQPYFPSSEMCVDEVAKLAKSFKENGKNIIILEFAECGDSYHEIYDAIGDYEHFDWADKWRNSGARQINEILMKHNAICRDFFFCGVNSYYCVKETAVELSKILDKQNINYNFFFVEDACYCVTVERSGSQRNGLEWIGAEIINNRFRLNALKNVLEGVSKKNIGTVQYYANYKKDYIRS